MITLHGTYDNGAISIDEEDLPRIKSKVNIQLIETSENAPRIRLGQYDLKGKHDYKNIRDLAYD